MAPRYYDLNDSPAWDLTSADVSRLGLDSSGPVDVQGGLESEHDALPGVGDLAWLVAAIVALVLSTASPSRALADPEEGAPRFPAHQVALNLPVSPYVSERETASEWRYVETNEAEAPRAAEVAVVAPAFSYDLGDGEPLALRPRGAWGNPADPMGVMFLRLPCTRH
jgi:hypothetical protein